MGTNPFGSTSSPIMPQSKKSISIYMLYDDLEALSYAVAEKAKQISDSEFQNRSNFSKVIKIQSPNNSGITLEVEFIKRYLLTASTKLLALEFSDLIIEAHSPNDLKIQMLNESEEILRINKVTFNNVRFVADPTYEELPPHSPFIINLCNSYSVEFINHCNAEVNLLLKYGPEKIGKNIDTNSSKFTRVLINNCEMQNFIIENVTEIAHTEVDILNSAFVDVEVNYERVKEFGRGEIKIHKNTFRKLLIHMRPDIIGSRLFVLISSNIIDTLTFSLPERDDYECNTRIVNKNQIEFLRCDDRYPNITAWGLHESIGRGIINESPDARENIESNKEVLVKLKQQANDKGDRFQESTINYHVTSCDEQLISLEENKEFWQEKLIMQLGRLLSKHGTSWTWPLLWIAVSNIYIGHIIFTIFYSGFPREIVLTDLFHIVGTLLNPLTTAPATIEEISDCSNCNFGGITIFFIYFLFSLSKGFYAMCLYEFVRAARRFTIK